MFVLDPSPVQPHARDHRRALASPWSLIAIITTLCRIPSFLRPVLDSDETQYAAIAELIRAGGRLYGNGGVDLKPPGIFWTYAAVFGVAGRYATWAVHALALVVVIATAWMLCAIAIRLAGERAGRYAGVCYGVFTTVYYPKMLAANTEIFMMAALSGMTLLVLRARDERRVALVVVDLIGAGALVALASAFKQSAALNLAVIAAGVIATARWRTRLAAAATGFAVMLGAGALAVIATSSLSAMWHWCAGQLVGSYGANAWRSAVWAHLAVGLLPFIASSLIVWLAAARSAARLREAPAALRVVWLWLAISLASSFASGHFFAHYFIQPLAPLCVIAAGELARLRALRRVAAGLIALPAAGFFVLNVVLDPISETLGAPSPDYRGPVAWVRAQTTPDERIFVWGMFPPIYVLADRLPASRFVGFMRGAERSRGAPPEASWDMGPEVWPALAEDFAAHPPALIIDTATANYCDFARYPMMRFPALAALLASYRAVAVIDGVTMYRRTPTLR